MQILPDRATDRAWDADIVLESRPAAAHRFLNQILDDCTALGPQPAGVAILMERKVSSRIPNDDATKSAITDEYVGTEAEDEVGDVELTRGQNRVRELVCRDSFEVQVCWATDAKRRVRREDLV